MLRWLKSQETWIYEQTLRTLVVAWATVAQIDILDQEHALTHRSLIAVLFGSLMMVVSQKTRSFASRQAEKDLEEGVVLSQLECHVAQARWAWISQALGLFMSAAVATTWIHLLLFIGDALFVVGWRAFYLARVRAWKRS